MAGHLGVSDDAFMASFTQPNDLSGWRMLEAKQAGPGSALTGDVSGPGWGSRTVLYRMNTAAAEGVCVCGNGAHPGARQVAKRLPVTSCIHILSWHPGLSQYGLTRAWPHYEL
jgi:hypothetical protein